MTVRAAIYLRISEDRTGEGLGVARQRQACEQLCAARGWKVVEVLEENDTSASGDRPRPLFTRLLEMIEVGEVDAVVVWHADRLVRRLVDLERVIELCERNCVKLATVSGDLDLSTDAGRLNARILAAVARNEVERKSARQRAAFEQAAAAGKPTGGRRAFGYTADHLHLEPTEAPIAAEMFQRFAAGESLGEIMRDLNKREILTPRGFKWTTGTVKTVLKNPRYAALRGVRRVKLVARGRTSSAEGGHLQREHWYSVAGRAVWPAIVDEATWRACERRLRDPARAKYYTGSTQQYLLSGLAVCGVCGRKLKSGTNQGGRTLKCPEGPGRHVVRRAVRIEEFVVAVILERLRRPDAIELVQLRSGQGVDLRRLREEAEGLRKNLGEYAEDAGAGRLTRQEYFVLREAAHVRLAGIDEQLANASRKDVIAAVVGTGRDPIEAWEACSLSAKRAVIDTLCTVRVMPARPGRPKSDLFNPASLRIEWK